MICEWSFMGQTRRPNSTLVFSADKIYLEEKVNDKCLDYVMFSSGKKINFYHLHQMSQTACFYQIYEISFVITIRFYVL